MVITKHEDVTKQGFCKYTEENSVFWEVSYWYFFNFNHVNKWILWCCLDNESWDCTPVNNNNQYYSCALNFGGLRGGSGFWVGVGTYLSLSGSKEGGRVVAGTYLRLCTYSNIKYVTNLVVFVQSAAAPLTVWQSHPCILWLNVK